MSNSYDMISTVDIDISRPIVDGTSFDNLLIVGPLPKVAPETAPPKVAVYADGEVTAAGWKDSGADADPVGLAAKIAFSQTPKPKAVYIAPQQLTEKAISAGKVIDDVNEIIADKVGTNEGLTGCTIDYDTNQRVVTIRLTGAVTGVKNTGIFEAIGAAVDSGYKVFVNDTPLTDADSFKTLPVFEQISTLTKGSAPVEFVISVNTDDVKVSYGVIVCYPNAKTGEGEPNGFTAYIIDSPQNEVEPAVEAVKRAISTPGWYVVCTAGVDPSEYEEIAAYIESQEKMFYYTETGFFGVGEDGTNKPSIGEVYFRSIGIYGREEVDQSDDDIPQANLYANVAHTAEWLSHTPGSETAAFKQLSAIYPSKLSTNEMKSLEESSLNYFVTVGNRNITMNGKTVGGEWADVIRFRDWLKNDMQVRIVNTFVTSPKIPYTDKGISIIQNQMLASLKAGQDAGGISETEYDGDGKAIPGYTVTVPRAYTLSDSDRASRKLKGCKFTARLSGAIHFAEISGSLTYSL